MKNQGVYFLVDNELQRFKIGKTIELKQRFYQLNTTWNISTKDSFFIETESESKIERGLQKMLDGYSKILENEKGLDGYSEWFSLDGLPKAIELSTVVGLESKKDITRLVQRYKEEPNKPVLTIAQKNALKAEKLFKKREEMISKNKKNMEAMLGLLNKDSVENIIFSGKEKTVCKIFFYREGDAESVFQRAYFGFLDESRYGFLNVRNSMCQEGCWAEFNLAPRNDYVEISGFISTLKKVLINLQKTLQTSKPKGFKTV